MIYVSPIKLNNIYYPTRKNISFKESAAEESSSNNAALSLQSPDAMIKFQKDFKLSHAADAVQSNPLKALVIKIEKALKAFFRPEIDDSLELTDRYLLY